MKSAGILGITTTIPTDDRLEAILTIDGKAGLARQLDRVYDVNAHLDHALHNHIVFLELWPVSFA